MNAKEKSDGLGLSSTFLNGAVWAAGAALTGFLLHKFFGREVVYVALRDEDEDEDEDDT